MFTKPIYSTQLTGEDPDRLFTNITASGALDMTFLTTMRALLHKRIPEGEKVHLVCKALHYSLDEIETISTSQAMGRFIPGEAQLTSVSTHRIVIVYTMNQNTGTKMLELVRAKFGTDRRHLDGFAVQQDLHIFYARKVNALFYYNATENMTVIFADKLEIKQFHALQMMLPKYFPRLFKDNPLTESETALLKSLGNKSAVDYERFIEEFAKSLDIWEHVQGNTPPPMDGSDASANFLNERFPNSVPQSRIILPAKAIGLIQDYITFSGKVKEFTELKQLAENQLKQMLGENEIGETQTHIVQWKTNKRCRRFSIKAAI